MNNHARRTSCHDSYLVKAPTQLFISLIFYTSLNEEGVEVEADCLVEEDRASVGMNLLI